MKRMMLFGFVGLLSVLSACTSPSPVAPQAVPQTVIVPQTVVIPQTVVVSQTVVVQQTVVVPQTVVVQPTAMPKPTDTPPAQPTKPVITDQKLAPDMVQTADGIVAATRDSGPDVRIFKMIPFAQPPVGNLRWQPPQPVIPWTGVRKADNFSPPCMQDILDRDSHLYTNEEVSSEDCLYLNVWTPAQTATAKLPVMVWFYGGSFVRGSGSTALYDGKNLARKGVVVVTFNYRVGVFGYLAHPDLTKESANKTSGNYGVLDQIAALKWVQKNIAAFGGDPSNVTIFGQSAGAVSVSVMMASPLVKGLFQRAVGESGGEFSTNAPPLKLADAEKVGAAWAQKNFNATSIAQLRAVSAWDLQKVAMPVGMPIVDGYVVPDYVDNIFAKSMQNDVPLLTGWTKDERSTFVPMASTVASYAVAAKTLYGDFADRFLQVYPATTDAQALAQSYASMRDGFVWSNWTWANAQSSTGKSQVFVYYWFHEPPWYPNQKLSTADPASRLGAYHSSELAYLFRNLDVFVRPYTVVDYQLSDTLSSYWVNFAKNGDPNGTGLPTWPVYTKSNQVVLYLGDKIETGPVPSKAGIDFFDSYYNAKRPPLK